MPKGNEKNLIGSLVCDFTSEKSLYRQAYGGGRTQHLPRAIGMKKGHMPQIVDATAGLGRDSFLLASLGAHVLMIERSGVVYKLLKQGLIKASKFDGNTEQIINRMNLIHGDSKNILQSLSPEIIYIDPMHPIRKKSALVKKEMRILRDIVGADSDCGDLIRVALKRATKRVVLKWPLSAEPITGIVSPSHQIIGKTTRYDVFMINQLPMT
tara:strand:+ start:3211 stop:3843 length:633 start_codon:yes stop_codon:yes gene_type:complete